MAAAAQVTWAKFDAKHSEIIAIGGVRKSFFGTSQWQLSAEEAVAAMEHDEWRFFVEVDNTRHWVEIDEEADRGKTLSVDGPIKALM
ncbi:hypothetical protein [Aestuariicoccus sp. MJ-SS9]|uniref:hypothetical protein n=1 Tax=Aestuariicoccus sp. MJ-SS9 TaxID=3079855 RepID=UPI00290FDCE5|nr:hypothetical protein [Aestuariicoccus sp. MJ-SS9]MDU8913401.1 hypothetical protein [Aestuariicoccus sp. MJ-SS9]